MHQSERKTRSPKAVLMRHAEMPNRRFRQIMTSLVQHLHSFAREVKLTEARWFAGIQFLPRPDTCVLRQAPGSGSSFRYTRSLDAEVTAQNNRKPEGYWESTIFRPFPCGSSPEYARGDDIANGAKGEPFVPGHGSGTSNGKAIPKTPDWETLARLMDSFYDVQYANQEAHRARATLHAGPDGKNSISAPSSPKHIRSHMTAL